MEQTYEASAPTSRHAKTADSVIEARGPWLASLFDKARAILHRLARCDAMHERRTAIAATYCLVYMNEPAGHR